MTAEYVNARIEALHREKQEIMNSYIDIPQKQKEVSSISINDWKKLTIEGKNKIARDFIDKVVLTKDNAEIFYK